MGVRGWEVGLRVEGCGVGVIRYGNWVMSYGLWVIGYKLWVIGYEFWVIRLWNVPGFERETKAECQVIVFLHR